MRFGITDLDRRLDLNHFLILLKSDLMMCKEISLAQYGVDTWSIRETNLNIDRVLRPYKLDTYSMVIHRDWLRANSKVEFLPAALQVKQQLISKS